MRILHQPATRIGRTAGTEARLRDAQCIDQRRKVSRAAHPAHRLRPVADQGQRARALGEQVELGLEPAARDPASDVAARGLDECGTQALSQLYTSR